MEEFIKAHFDSIVTGVCSLLGGLIAGGIITFRKLEKIYEKVEEIAEHKDLNRNHMDVLKGQEKLSIDHSGLSKDHQKILDKIDVVKDTASGIKGLLDTSKETNELRYKNLDDKQKAIIDSLKELEALADELKMVVTENSHLKEINKKQHDEINRLEQLVMNKSRQRERSNDYDLEI
jgi:hypothetical protein